MSIRKTTHVLKNSDIVNRPLPSSLLKGEPIVNTADGIVFFSGITTSTSEWTPAGTGATASFFEVGSNLYDLRLRNQITKYQGQTGSGLVGKFLSGTTTGFVLADISDIASSVDSHTTGATWSPNTLTISLNNGKPSVPVTIDSFNGITLYGTNNVNGNLTVTGTTTLNGPAYYNNTASASNEVVNYGLLTAFSQTNDVYVTGGTVTSLGNLELFRNDGATVTVPKVTYWTSGSTGTDSIKAINSTGLDSTGDRAVAWGNQTLASGQDSTAWGIQTSATTIGSTASGYQTISSGQYSHAEGQQTTASGTYGSHSEGYLTTSTGLASHAEGLSTISSGAYSHAEGDTTTASGDVSHAEGQITTASGYVSHAEGHLTTASGTYSHAEGQQTIALGLASHAEGVSSISSGYYSHAEGVSTTSSGLASHAEGLQTTASGNYSHAQGSGTTATGDASFASGVGSRATSIGSFIHSQSSVVNGTRSVVLGGQNITGSTNDTVYVPYLNLNYVPTLNNSNTQILSRNASTGQVEYTALSAFTSLDTFVTGFTYNPSSNTFTISQNQGQPNLTASIGSVSGLTVSNLTAGRVVYVGTGGLLTDEAGFEYNDGTNLLTVGNINVQNASGTTANIGQGGLVIGSGGSLATPGIGDLTIHGNLTVFGTETIVATNELYIEDPQITLNYNPTGDTSSTSVASGIKIQDGNGTSTGDTYFTIGQMQNLTGIVVGENPDVSEYTGLNGYNNRGWVTQLNDIVIRNNNINEGSPNGVRVLAEFDILDGGSY